MHMNIAHYASAFLPHIGGAEIAVHNIALQQQQAGHKVTVIVSESGTKDLGLPYPVLTLLPMSVRLAKSRYLRDFGGDRLVAWQLMALQRRHHFDIWHIHVVYPAGILALPMLTAMKLPAVVTCQGEDIQVLPEIGYGARLDPRLNRDITRVLHQVDRVTAISDSIKDDYLSLGVPSEKIRAVPNGVDAGRIRSLDIDRGQVRAAQGWPEDRTILLTVGRNHPKKGYTYIPPIIKQLAAQRQDFLWVIVGRGAEPILSQAEALGVARFLRVIPQIGYRSGSGSPLTDGRLQLPSDDLIAIFKAVDIFVLPSLLEGLALVSVEAMAAGLPVVTTDAPGCRDAVEHEGTGLVSPVGDTTAMAGNILRLLDDPALRERLAARGKQVSTKYEWQTVAGQYYDIYRELVPGASTKATA
jgi:glycosyltransferase involved in cell wall biosynthesis